MLFVGCENFSRRMRILYMQAQNIEDSVVILGTISGRYAHKEICSKVLGSILRAKNLFGIGVVKSILPTG